MWIEDLRQGCVMCPRLLSLYIRRWCGPRSKCRVLGKGLEQLRANCNRIEMIQLLFPYALALVADSEKLCRLGTEFGKVCRLKKL